MLEEKIRGRFIREWKRDDNRANLVIVHGVAEHSGRYVHVGSYFHERGYNVYTGDLVGHGLSDGPRVFIKSADDYIDDVNLFIRRVENDKPVFILGHSMGGFIALYYGVKCHNPKIKGLIVSSPYLKERLDIPFSKVMFGRAVAKLYPRLKLKSGIKSHMVCRDKEVCRKYEKDKLNTDIVTVGWFTAMEKARKHTVLNAPSFHYPCLMLQAGDDIIVDPKANRSFFESIPVEDKEYELFEGFYHEILNDPERERALSRIYTWTEARI
ncbi:MAG TPA: alpha/beta hydrolase [Clostridia bacterium]|nr:alpha/beta hydrolase [Clostridia bacterium]